MAFGSPAELRGFQKPGLHSLGQVWEPFWWQLVCSPRADGDVKRWGAHWGLGWGGAAGPYIFPVSCGQASDTPGSSWDENGTLATAPCSCPSCPPRRGVGPRDARLFHPALQPLSSNLRHSGCWEARGPGGLVPGSHLGGQWRNLKPLQQTTWAIPVGRRRSAGSSVSVPASGSVQPVPITVYAPSLTSGASGACVCLLQGSLPCSGSEVRETVLPGLQPQPRVGASGLGEAPPGSEAFREAQAERGCISLDFGGDVTYRAGQESQACCLGVCLPDAN